MKSPGRGRKPVVALLILVLGLFAGAAFAQDSQPNIVVIWGDDIGESNISAYNFGLMGYQTPNIDRLAREGMMFTDMYADQSCTAGRSSFITGQSVIRTGLSKVGMPAAPQGLQFADVTTATLLKEEGTRRVSSARTTWATATSSCPPCTGSTSSTGTSTT
jgi:hypothetical protein